MANKVTLITPPDIFENSNKSIMVADLTDQEQDDLSLALGTFKGDFDLNIYFYKGEADINWLFHAVNTADYVYINFDNHSDIGHMLASYILSKPNVWYSTKNLNTQAVFSFINKKHVDNIQEFIEKVLDENSNTGL
jgi:hypothetical protein